jgi:hypothetical protein
MRWTRYEILLPLCYNDGRPIEASSFHQTTQDLVEQFGAATISILPALGLWKYKGTLYDDELLRPRVDVPGSFAAHDFFRKYKEILKNRFDQIDIWISSYEIQIL